MTGAAGQGESRWQRIRLSCDGARDGMWQCHLCVLWLWPKPPESRHHLGTPPSFPAARTERSRFPSPAGAAMAPGSLSQGDGPGLSVTRGWPRSSLSQGDGRGLSVTTPGNQGELVKGCSPWSPISPEQPVPARAREGAFPFLLLLYLVPFPVSLRFPGNGIPCCESQFKAITHMAGCFMERERLL